MADKQDFYKKINVHKDGRYNTQSISWRLKFLTKEQGLTHDMLVKKSGLSRRVIVDALGINPENFTYYTASTLADVLNYDIEKLYHEALITSVQFDDTNINNLYTLYFSGYDIAMFVRLLKFLDAKKLLPHIEVEVHGYQKQQPISIKHKIVGHHSNGHIQCFFMQIGDELLSIGGPLSCLESEDIRSENISIFMPQFVFWEIRDTVFAIYSNEIMDFNLDKMLISKGSTRYILTLLKKHSKPNKALSFLINNAYQLISNDLDYSAVAEGFKFFAIKKDCKPSYYKIAFNILRNLFYQCLTDSNLKDAEYILSAIAAIVQNNDCACSDFIALSESIIDQNFGIEHSNNFNLIILTTLKSSIFKEHLDKNLCLQIEELSDSISDFVKLQYRKIYLR